MCEVTNHTRSPMAKLSISTDVFRKNERILEPISETPVVLVDNIFSNSPLRTPKASHGFWKVSDKVDGFVYGEVFHKDWYKAREQATAFWPKIPRDRFHLNETIIDKVPRESLNFLTKNLKGPSLRKALQSLVVTITPPKTSSPSQARRITKPKHNKTKRK